MNKFEEFSKLIEEFNPLSFEYSELQTLQLQINSHILTLFNRSNELRRQYMHSKAFFQLFFFNISSNFSLNIRNKAMKSGELIEFPEMIFPNIKLRLEENPSYWEIKYEAETHSQAKPRKEDDEE